MREIQRLDSRVSGKRAGFLHVQVRACLCFVHKAGIRKQRVRAHCPGFHAGIRLRIPGEEQRCPVRAGDAHAVGRHGVRHRHKRKTQRADLYLISAFDRMLGKERAVGNRFECFKRFCGRVERHAPLFLSRAHVLLL